MAPQLCQKCFDGPVGSCACSVPQRPWEPSQHEVTRRGERVTPMAKATRTQAGGTTAQA